MNRLSIERYRLSGREWSTRKRDLGERDGFRVGGLELDLQALRICMDGEVAWLLGFEAESDGRDVGLGLCEE